MSAALCGSSLLGLCRSSRCVLSVLLCAVVCSLHSASALRLPTATESVTVVLSGDTAGSGRAGGTAGTVRCTQEEMDRGAEEPREQHWRRTTTLMLSELTSAGTAIMSIQYQYQTRSGITACVMNYRSVTLQEGLEKRSLFQSRRHARSTAVAAPSAVSLVSLLPPSLPCLALRPPSLPFSSRSSASDLPERRSRSSLHVRGRHHPALPPL